MTLSTGPILDTAPAFYALRLSPNKRKGSVAKYSFQTKVGEFYMKGPVAK